MSEPYISEIQMFGFDFAPRSWALCDGQLLQITQNDALHSLIGINFGGDGRSTFGLPDLQGRTPVNITTKPETARGLSNYTIGQKRGAEKVALSINEMPPHNHTFMASAMDATQKEPAGLVLADAVPIPPATDQETYTEANNLIALNPDSIALSGGDKRHENMQPSIVLNFCIALQGIFPSRN